MGLAEFLEWEAAQPDRWELIAGGPRAMVGGSVAHNLVSGNLFACLRAALRERGGDCLAYLDGLKVVTPSEEVLYPDVMVACGPRDPLATQILDPLLVAEVLSPTTEAQDRSRKWFAYQTIPSLRHYLLLAQDRPSVEVFSRAGEGEAWRYERLDGAAVVLTLPALAIELRLAELFERVRSAAEG